MSATNGTNTGLLVGFWEGHHKAFELNGTFDSKLIILNLEEDGTSANYYFTTEASINSQNIIYHLQEWFDTYRNVYRLFFPNLEPTFPSCMSREDFISSVVALFTGARQTTSKIGYVVEITPPNRYALIILNYHPNMPILDTVVNSNIFNSWNIDSLLSSQLLVSLLEVRDNWREFISSGTRGMSAFRYLSEKELSRRAASLLLDRWARSINNLSTNEQIALNYFYSNIDKICSMGYEKRMTRGFVLIANTQNQHSIAVRFINPIPLSHHKGARKIIEMTGGNRFALSDGINLYGIGTQDSNLSQSDAIRIRFQNFNEWTVTYGDTNEISFCVKDGTPMLPRLAITEEEFINGLSNRFSGYEVDSHRIYQIVQASLNASHGALIVVCNEAEAEASRLQSQATAINPQILEADILEGVFSIDGAIMLGLQGTCYAIGVILDGLANNIGEPARGSRYNSSVRYINSINQPNTTTRAMAIVISEDGHFDMI